ncbi:hypothetical protein RCH23_003266 [Cryobacterium sp. CAN_C3]|uniref:hypothetical protein n=1 Tax=unclassified Cryobacterium TaxID=2649013 RepID=UPI0018C94DA5|nr:hypothetical protein [Cryobacterium sp. CAN_C3]MEC5155865.1 hypothetical protein [Cryobacterium sp. CAN_C3]
MSSRSHAAINIWRARNIRTTGDRAFTMYTVLMVALVTVIPVGRAVWLSAASPAGLALFADVAAPSVTSFIVAALWAGALLLGRDRGPAVLPPFLTHALAMSDLPRFNTFRAPLFLSGAIAAAVCTIAAGLIGMSLASNGLAEPGGVATFTTVGGLVGVTATVAWLAGQVFPRAAVAGALGILALGLVTVAVPGMQLYAPWGWVGLAYPTSGISHSLPALATMAALAAALVALVPVMMNRLGLAELTTQAARWDSATTHAAGMEFSSAATIYQPKPHLGRRIRAVRPHTQLAWTFLVRDTIGATRAPGRLIVGILALTAAGVLLALAFAPTTPGWLLGAAAGVIAFAGLGPLTDGIRHAASVAADFPLYGISDERLLAHHALFPLAVTVVVLLAVVIVCSIIIGTATGAAAVSSLALGLLALVARISNALKGPLPTTLLTPISTPAGDPMAAVRIAWALDAILLAALGGGAAALAFEAPVLLLGVTATLISIGIKRWRDRR